jgi:hypothetical protein
MNLPDEDGSGALWTKQQGSSREVVEPVEPLAVCERSMAHGTLYDLFFPTLHCLAHTVLYYSYTDPCTRVYFRTRIGALG